MYYNNNNRKNTELRNYVIEIPFVEEIKRKRKKKKKKHSFYEKVRKHWHQVIG